MPGPWAFTRSFAHARFSPLSLCPLPFRVFISPSRPYSSFPIHEPSERLWQQHSINIGINAFIARHCTNVSPFVCPIQTHSAVSTVLNLHMKFSHYINSREFIHVKEKRNNYITYRDIILYTMEDIRFYTYKTVIG